MMNTKEASALLTSLAQAEAKNGRILNYVADASWQCCPTCGIGNLKDDFQFDVAVIDATDPITKDEGLAFAFYIRHPKSARTCLFAFNAIPAHGDKAAFMLRFAEALQVVAMERLMKGLN